MSKVLDVLKEIYQIVSKAFQEDVLDVENFFVDGAKYAAANIKPVVLKTVTDCMAAAEQAFTADGTVDKYAYAFSNIIAALEKDAIAFVEADLNYAIETVIQQRNARVAQTPQPSTASGDQQQVS